MKVHRPSLLAGAGIAVAAVFAVVLVASNASAFRLPWQSDKAEVTVIVKGSVSCSNPGSLDGWGGSPASLSITVNGVTEEVKYPPNVRLPGSSVFVPPDFQAYQRRVKIARNADQTKLSYRLFCHAQSGGVSGPYEKSFDVGRKDLSRTICSYGGPFNPCVGPQWTSRIGGCALAVLAPGLGSAMVELASSLQGTADEDAVFRTLAKDKRGFVGAIVGCLKGSANAVPAQPTTPAQQPIPAVPQQPVAPAQTTKPLAGAPKTVCGTSWRINWWAAQVCSTMSSNGSQVSGHLSISCYQGNSQPVACQEIRIREVELFVNDIKLGKWVGGNFQQGALTTGNATYPCTADTTYYLKGWEITVQGPDGTWSDTETIGPQFNYQC
ncbi:MAG TPA: hypothetical protein DGT23_01650 [Micromonosporaceae bacterium]|nr:hypothetical protein [Micromonosporaceae bacterium]